MARPWPISRRWAAFGGLVLLYAVATPGSRSETDDGFWFADLVARAPLADLVSGGQTGHVLYLPLQRVVVRLLEVLPGSVDTYSALRGVSVVSAAAAVVVFASLLGRLGLGRTAVLVASAGLATSYGFWRYANEAEVYGLGALLTVGLAWLVLGHPLDDRRAVLAGLVGGLALLVNLLCGIPAAISVPLLLLRSRSHRALLRYVVVFGLVATGGYGIAYAGSADGRSPQAWMLDAQPDSQPLRPARLTAGAVGAVQTVAAGSSAFASDRVGDELTERFPTLNLNEERYAGDRFGPAATAVAVGVALALLSSLVVLGMTVVRNRRLLEPRSGARTGTALPGTVLLYFGSWAVVHAIVILPRAAASAEAWIGVLLPVWVGVAYLVERARRTAPSALFVLPVALLALHNAVSGLWVMRTDAVDYNARKAAWLLAEAGPDDAIVTADATGFSRYLTYRSPARVVVVDGADRDAFDRLDDRHDRVFVTGDVLGSRPGAGTRLVHADEFGGVFERQ